MPSPSLAIDDVEVRQQHRRQVRRSFVGLLVGAAGFWGCILVLPTLGFCVSRLAHDGSPGNVVAVDHVHDRVAVSYSGKDGVATVWMGVDDPSAYEDDDQVRVFLTGEDQHPWTLDREPLNLMFITPAREFGSLVFLTVLVGGPVVALFAHTRRRCLSAPWKRVTGESWSEGTRAFAFLPHVDDGSYWKLSEPLPTSGHFAADLAGAGSRRVVLRNAGSTQLVVGRRCRARSGAPSTPELDPRYAQLGVDV